MRDYYKNSIEYKLIAGCKKGKKKYQEMLYKHFYNYAFNICRLNTYSRDEAVEVMNDSFLKVFLTIQQFNPDEPFKSWLRKIIINTAIDNYRKNKKHYYHCDLAKADFTDINSENAISKLNAEDILKLLDQLPAAHREVFILYEIQGFSHNEIANKLQIGDSTSRTFLTRAKNKLRALLSLTFKVPDER